MHYAYIVSGKNEAVIRRTESVNTLHEVYLFCEGTVFDQIKPWIYIAMFIMNVNSNEFIMNKITQFIYYTEIIT